MFFGFLAFNGGSQTSIQNEGDGAAVSVAVVNTMISGSFAAFSSLLINKSEIFGNAHWSLLITINGTLTGMVNSKKKIFFNFKQQFQFGYNNKQSQRNS